MFAGSSVAVLAANHQMDGDLELDSILSAAPSKLSGCRSRDPILQILACPACRPCKQPPTAYP